MIDLALYRCRIGIFGGGGFRGKGSTLQNKGQKFSVFSPTGCPSSTKFYRFEKSSNKCEENVVRSSNYFMYSNLFMLLYFYIILLFTIITLPIVLSPSFKISHIICPGVMYLKWDLSFITISQIKIAYFYLIFYVIVRSICTRKKWPTNIVTSSAKCSRFVRILSHLILGLLALNFLLIGIVNPSMLNPGPSSLKVYYQNVQGLIPFSELGNPQPRLDMKKIYEINTYIEKNKPDIVMLNETWLKKSVSDHEVIHNQCYRIWRNDRSQVSHPADPTDPNKFKRNGGGVLIAVRSDIQAQIKKISVRKGAEIVGSEITIDGKIFIFCTIYRVGTLGTANHESIMNTIKSFYKIRNPRKNFIVGDLNLSKVTWPIADNQEISDSTEKLFVESFSELGLTQCINVPTHIKGRTLDLLVTNSDQLLLNTNIHEHNQICKSDHFAITFEIKTNCKHRPVPKRKILNYKKANWPNLKSKLGEVPWITILDNRDIESAWSNFKNTLFPLVNMNIPTITIKSTFSAPWFDSESFEAYRTKERAHKRLKANKTELRELNFITKRNDFNKLCDMKMRNNLYNDDDPALITKKFYSHVKSKSKNHRLPECMHRKNIYRNTPSQKAEMFNNFFYDQFSAQSSYDIDIDWTDDDKLNKLTLIRHVDLMVYLEKF